MTKLDISSAVNWCKDLFTAGLASGKKNAPQIMTGLGLILGWGAGVMLAKEAVAAHEAVKIKEQELQEKAQESNAEGPSEAPESLERKDKIIIYIQHCWPAMALGAASTGLTIGAQKITLDRLASMYVMTKFLEDKDSKNQKLIEKLKEKAGIKEDSKAEVELKKELREEDESRERVNEELKLGRGTGKTLFFDHVTGVSFYNDFFKVKNGIYEFNEAIKKKRKKALMSKVSDAFFSSSDNVWSSTNALDEESVHSDVYSSLDIGYLLEAIGEVKETGKKNKPRLGELLEVRYYGGGDPLKEKDILEFDERYIDPETGVPLVVDLDYGDYVVKTAELDERCPF